MQRFLCRPEEGESISNWDLRQLMSGHFFFFSWTGYKNLAVVVQMLGNQKKLKGLTQPEENTTLNQSSARDLFWFNVLVPSSTLVFLCSF